jgi:hypothetical protein
MLVVNHLHGLLVAKPDRSDFGTRSPSMAHKGSDGDRHPVHPKAARPVISRSGDWVMGLPSKTGTCRWTTTPGGTWDDQMGYVTVSTVTWPVRDPFFLASMSPVARYTRFPTSLGRRPQEALRRAITLRPVTQMAAESVAMIIST